MSARLPVRDDTPEADRDDGDVQARVHSLVGRYYDFVWRTLQYVGLSEANAEDAAQQVMCVLARRIREIEPGAERPFLFSACIRVAAEVRRAARRRPAATDAVDLDALAAETPALDELVDQRRARQLLGKVLETMPEDLRLVFVLYEIEELAMPVIAETLGIPVGTVASRLRRARETFHSTVARLQAASRDRVRTAMNEPKRLSSESASPLERAMLDAWRAGAPRAGKQRALAAAAAVAGSGLAGGKAAAGVALVKAGATGWIKWLAVAGVVGAATLAGGAMRERAKSAETSAAAPVPRAPETVAKKVSVEGPANEPEAPAAASARAGSVEPLLRRSLSRARSRARCPLAASAPVRRALPAEAPSGSTMPEELSWLERAKSAMAAGNPAQALSLLDGYAAHFAHAALLPEATGARIEATPRRGRWARGRTCSERVPRCPPGESIRAAHPVAPRRCESVIGAPDGGHSPAHSREGDDASVGDRGCVESRGRPGGLRQRRPARGCDGQRRGPW